MTAAIDAAALIGTHDVLLVTLDTLRYDVAAAALAAGRTPNLARVLPGGAWEERHSPATFTYAAHQAFFAGFLPTPVAPGNHHRLFAARFAGSETTGPLTAVFDAADIVTGLAARGYRTICIGGVGFFNKLTPLGSVLPGLFHESHWSPELGVTSARSTEMQVRLAERLLLELPAGQRAFLFVNISALHQPNCLFTPGASADNVDTQAAALAYVDRWMPVLFDALRRRGPCLAVICSDHGTAYGEAGYTGHRIAHPVVWNVPYAEFILEAA
ncbi:MAG TPA: STM4013/SEN3800 family hydrolase [Tepidisphaeraceae bacterium]|jgi:hypothetical protein|nr:STM4013/SEN3800 family hydrolase [Tepidisphaeraceae bacterium]